MKKWIEKFEKVFVAAAFAEANCHDMALETLGLRREQEEGTSLTLFLKNVGLSNARICYVTATVT